MGHHPGEPIARGWLLRPRQFIQLRGNGGGSGIAPATGFCPNRATAGNHRHPVAARPSRPVDGSVELLNWIKSSFAVAFDKFSARVRGESWQSDGTGRPQVNGMAPRVLGPGGTRDNSRGQARDKRGPPEQDERESERPGGSRETRQIPAKEEWGHARFVSFLRAPRRSISYEPQYPLGSDSPNSPATLRVAILFARSSGGCARPSLASGYSPGLPPGPTRIDQANLRFHVAISPMTIPLHRTGNAQPAGAHSCDTIGGS